MLDYETYVCVCVCACVRTCMCVCVHCTCCYYGDITCALHSAVVALQQKETQFNNFVCSAVSVQLFSLMIFTSILFLGVVRHHHTLLLSTAVFRE